MFCGKCGTEIPVGMRFCGRCGAKVEESSAVVNSANFFNFFSSGYSEKSGAKTAILAMLFGPLGIHDFYTGNIIRGVIKLILTFFGIFVASAIWTLIDIVRLALGFYKDGEGKVVKPAHWIFVCALIFAILAVVGCFVLIRIFAAHMA